VTLVLCPEHMLTLQKGGFTTKRAVAAAIWQRCNYRLAPHVGALVMTVIHLQKGKSWLLAVLLGSLVGFVARLLALLGLPLSSGITKFSSPESLHVVVAGADAGKFSAFAPGFGIGTKGMATAHMSNPVSRKVADPPRGRPHPPRAEGRLPSGGAIQLVNPSGKMSGEELQLAARAGQQGFPPGCTVGLMDINKHNGCHVLDKVEANFRRDYPGLDVKRYSKPTFSRPCPGELRQQILKECNVVVCALAD